MAFEVLTGWLPADPGSLELPAINMPDSGSVIWSGLEGTPTTIDAFFSLPSPSPSGLSLLNDEPPMSPSEPYSVSTPSVRFHLCLQSHIPILRLFLNPFIPQTD